MSELKALLQSIDGEGMESLRRTWRLTFGDEPPPLRSAAVLMRVLAERAQVEAMGGDTSLDQRLAKTAARHRVGSKPVVRTATFKPGSRLEREWKGQRHQVDVIDGGYVWNGQTYASLSPIARQITGARWNGPRFFGLREDAA